LRKSRLDIPKHERLIDSMTVQFYWADAAEELIGENVRGARRIATCGVYINSWLHVGKDDFLATIEGRKLGNEMIVEYHQNPMHHIATDRNLTIFLARKIACTCLDEEKHEAKQTPKAARCKYCSREGSKMKRMKCSQCKRVSYCGKECQQEDWKAGQECKLLAMMNNK